MTLTMNESVVLLDDYSDLSVQDFDVVYIKNSNEIDQSYSFQIIEISET